MTCEDAVPGVRPGPRTAPLTSTIAVPTPERLRRHREVRATLASRNVAHTPTVVVHARRRQDSAPARATVVAGRKVGKAVQRNRAKRRLRAVMTAECVTAGFDLVLVARARTVRCEWTTLRADVRRALAQLGAVASADTTSTS